jgi:CxxC motif-containing protein
MSYGVPDGNYRGWQRPRLHCKGKFLLKRRKVWYKGASNPIRVLTTTVKLKNSLLRRLPVRTDNPITKEMIFSCMKELDSVEAEAPVRAGDIIVENIFGSGVNIISTRSI